MLVRATLKDGTQVVSRFRKLTKLGRYAAAVLSGQKAFNVWAVAGDTHPKSGEATQMRSRELLSGTQILKLEQVRANEDGNYEPVAYCGRGSRGYHTFRGENIPEGAAKGVRYPKHRDPSTMRDYVILAVGAPAEGVNAAAPDVTYFLDGQGAQSRRPWDEEGDSGEDERDRSENDDLDDDNF